MITGTSISVYELRHVTDHTTGMQQPVQNSTSCKCGISTVSSQIALELAGPAQQTSITLSMYCNWRISMVFWTKGKLPLRHDRDVDDCDATGMSSDGVMN